VLSYKLLLQLGRFQKYGASKGDKGRKGARGEDVKEIIRGGNSTDLFALAGYVLNRNYIILKSKKCVNIY
jgi:hypothetical protein